MNTYEKIGVKIPRIFLPKAGIDLKKWAVVACDQFTSEPEYWDQVKKIVGDSPSTFHLILPEIYLGTAEEQERTQQINFHMQEYLQNGIMEPFEGLIYVERSVGGKSRRGLLLCLDLEQYDFHMGSQSLIRATEGTIIERLPPRIRIREKATLELPHIMVLIDDPDQTVIEPIGKLAAMEEGRLTRLYDFDLMMDGGHLTGYQVVDPQVEADVARALATLADPENFRRRYGVGEDQKAFLFAMGDGNHSLATAKSIWEKIKPHVGLEHPARYALVEIENVHDSGLKFEAIHRVLFEVKTDPLAAMQEFYRADFSFAPIRSLDELMRVVDEEREGQRFGFLSGNQAGLVEIRNPITNLAVGTLQVFLDKFLKEGNSGKIDYVHGGEVVTRLGSQAGNAGFYLPAMHKNELFKTVILDGALSRKTFSMGEAREKRFYMESRRIID